MGDLFYKFYEWKLHFKFIENKKNFSANCVSLKNNMKIVIKKIIKILISNDFIYKTFDKLLTIGWMIKFQRQLLDRRF